MVRLYAISMLVGALIVFMPFSAARAFGMSDIWRAERIFKTLDDNKDGFVDMDEVRRHHREFFEALDADKSGHVSLAEVKTLKKPEARFNELNGDQDQYLTFEESFKIEEGRFAAADADKDGRISYEEYLRHARSVSP